MRISNIKEQIILKISEISDFVSVLGYQKFEDVGYPAVSLLYRGGRSVEVDTIRNLETHRFEVQLKYIFNDAEDSETVLVDLVEKLIDKLDEDRTLGGIVQNLRIEDISEMIISDADQIRAFAFDIEADLFKNRG